MKELKHLRLNKNNIVFWGDNNNKTNLKKRVKGTSKQDYKDANFSERINLDRKITREGKDLLNLITSLKDLKDIDLETLS